MIFEDQLWGKFDAGGIFFLVEFLVEFSIQGILYLKVNTALKIIPNENITKLKVSMEFSQYHTKQKI